MRYFSIVVMLFALLGCQKERLFEVKVDDLYVMKPHESDAIKNRIHAIYQNYGVAVFFTDTVGQYFVKDDVNGNPVYRTEKLDLGWYFTSFNQSKYNIDKIEEYEEQVIVLDYMEKYLKSIAKPLYPFSILLARQLTVVSPSGDAVVYKGGQVENYFRTMVMTDRLPATTDTSAYFKTIVRSLIRKKLNDFPSELNKFGAVSKREWYDGKKFSDLNPKLAAGTSVGILYTPALETVLKNQGWTPTRIETFKTEMRAVCGPFGFVSGNTIAGGYLTCSTAIEDLDGFVFEMLRTDKTEFKKRWGIFPLVMKKYEIIHDLINKELGVDI